MEFVKLYRDNQEAVKKALRAMWCSESHSDIQKQYIDQIAQLIDNELFTSRDYVPLVQCMDKYESINRDQLQYANSLINGLWKKSYDPYKHQVESWKALAGGKSVVVTTGTGSGKTECFMLPLVSDLAQQNKSNTIKAIFLYPLNALMEDQKDRLQEYLSGTDLRFAVYNGNLPSDDGSAAETPKLRTQLKRQVAEERQKYPNIVPTRKELWNNPPDIILTNPTMLEYMLLRNKDQVLFSPKSLRWIVIDEAHTFSGAGAAELAMLIRRVLDAFNIQKPDDIRFATSSATIGNASDTKQKNVAIVKFIQDITGSRNVVAIDGNRVYKEQPGDSPELRRCRNLLNVNDYVRLDELFPDEGETIEAKLSHLDFLCSLVNPLKAKLHLFYRVPTNGIRARLTDYVGNALKLYSHVPVQKSGAPYLELMRCEHCGNFFAMGETVKGDSNKYKATSSSDSDIFDFDTSDGKSSKLVFAFTDKQIDPEEKDGNTPVKIKDDTIEVDSSGDNGGWHIIQNVQKSCPWCGERIIGRDKDDDSEDETEISEIPHKARSFRVSGGYISRVLAPSILPNLLQSSSSDVPHHGEQYISFVDSRQGAAKATMQQNLEEERQWIYSRVYNELNKRATSIDPQIKQKRDKLIAAGGFTKEEIDEMVPLPPNYLTWSEIFQLLHDDKDAERLAYQFVNKRELSEEYDTDYQRVDPVYKSKYIYSSMIEQLGKRPKKVAAPETMGLFVSCYPKLDGIVQLPDEVRRFSDKYHLDISLQDWKDLLKLYLDNYVRSNESLYLMNGKGDDHLDIKNCCRRFGTTKPPRRPIHEKYITDDKQGRYLSTIILLATLIDPSSNNINETIYDHRVVLNSVLGAFWRDLKETTGLIQPSMFFDGTAWDYDRDKDAARGMQYRLNASDIAFKLYDKVWMCDSRLIKEKNPAPRPMNTLFKGYSPYIINNKAQKPLSDCISWNPYPYIDGMNNGVAVTINDIQEWAASNRTIMCDSRLWGIDGAFSNMLDTVHSYPDIFIQAEHTAQVDKLIAKQSQELFKAGQINILSCSTTMEMGVDLGNLEMVMMTSVPPHPSNYKQRAGRSGRNDNPRSACITLCSSDSVGLRTIINPMETLIQRPMQTPFVDLKSPQVIQRHANAYLFRLSKIFFDNARGNVNNLDQEIIEFFTPFSFGDDHGEIRYDQISDNEGNLKYPCDKLGDKNLTKYYQFRCFLDDCDTDPEYHLDALLKNTIFDSCSTQVIQNCRDEVERCYNELFDRADELGAAYDIAKNKALGDPKTQKQVKGNRLDTSYGYYLRHKYSELLSKNLIEFFATNRFTPNANMPVNVVEFDINNGKFGKFDRYKANNPSYPLQQAISQYSPGNTVVLENRTVVVRGLLYTGMFKSNVTFKKIYSDGINTVVGEERKGLLQQPTVPWPVNGRDELTMIEPYSFIPDINEDYSRVVEDVPYTQVSAQLVGAGDWADFSHSSSLVSVRNNRDCGDAKILYYNEGLGFGYCFCANCGKAILENAPGGGLKNMPVDMNNQIRDIKGVGPECFHYMINRKNKSADGRKDLKVECFGQNKIHRNVIIGGLIQTDYSEIRIRNDERNPWFSDRSNENLLITLGIVFTQSFVESLGKDRQDVDFAITPNGHLCIFDTNPGGSGYSNQLVNMSIMQSVINASDTLLNKIKTKDELIDRYTKRYYERIDIDAAREWIKAERESIKRIPDEVKAAYPNSQSAVFEDILSDYNLTDSPENYLFVDSNLEKWLYQDNSEMPSQTWKARIHELRIKGIRKTLCVVNPPAVINRPIISVLSQIFDWADVVSSPMQMPAGLFPLALVNGKFFFTNQKETATLNHNWSRGNVFCVDHSHMPAIAPQRVSLEQLPTSMKFVLDSKDRMKIKSKELVGLVCSKIPKMVNVFIDHCTKCSDNLEITSQDEHLKTAVGIVTTLQFAEWFIAQINKPYTITFKMEQYTDALSHDIAKNMPDSICRDDFLNGMADKWIRDLDEKNHIKGKLQTISSSRGSLPHWREFRLKCGNKELILYPNGGIINEWFYDRMNDASGLSMDTISHLDDIPLFRRKDVMYDAEIKDC